MKSITGLRPQIPIEETIGVDVVFTPDRTKWSRCIVVESGECTTVRNEDKLDMRQLTSKDQNGTDEAGSIGYSWFPGYALDVESGKRLNLFFGEDGCSVQPDGRGKDMVYNPSSTFFDDIFNPIYGGKHYLYISKSEYDKIVRRHGDWYS